jgi:hypothetical protein
MILICCLKLHHSVVNVPMVQYDVTPPARVTSLDHYFLFAQQAVLNLEDTVKIITDSGGQLRLQSGTTGRFIPLIDFLVYPCSNFEAGGRSILDGLEQIQMSAIKVYHIAEIF